MADGQFRCHCGAAYHGSDHCPHCMCEQYQGRQRCHVEGVPWFRIVVENHVGRQTMVGPIDDSHATQVCVGFEWFDYEHVVSITRVEMVNGQWQDVTR